MYPPSHCPVYCLCLLTYLGGTYGTHLRTLYKREKKKRGGKELIINFV